jgi:hypothetical protein
LKGTEANGLKRMIIVNCYDAGSFVKPSMTFIDMKETVETQMNKLKLSEKLIQDAKHSTHFKPLENDLTFITQLSSENGKRR